MKTRLQSARSSGGLSICALLGLCWTASAAGGTLVAVDDRFGVPYGEPLEVQSGGVLDNDTMDGRPARDQGVAVRLASPPAKGALECPADPTLSLCADGSFGYIPDPDFDGLDSFTYLAETGNETVAATVTLEACTGGPDRYACWAESAYLARLAALGASRIHEGFEDDGVWGSARSNAQIDRVAGVVSQGIRWTTNHPEVNGISTTSGAARTGLWGVYDPNHGSATGVPSQCDIDNPPLQCLYRDGITGTLEDGAPPLLGVGGFFRGMYGANLAVVLDDWALIGLGRLTGPDYQFFGVVDRSGFRKLEIREQDGKVGQALQIFADDLTLGGAPRADRPGVRRDVRFLLDADATSGWSSGDAVASFGVVGDFPVAGDWDGDGRDEIGVWRPSNGLFYLDIDGDRAWDRGDSVRSFGIGTDLPLIGDWNGDGVDDIGVWRPSKRSFYLDANGSGVWDAGDAIVPFGLSGDMPLAGDWNGDGIDEVGVGRPGTGRFFLDFNGNDRWDMGDMACSYGIASDIPLAGDWNADGADEIGVWRPSQHRFLLDSNGDCRWDPGDTGVTFGYRTDTPATGRW